MFITERLGCFSLGAGAAKLEVMVECFMENTLSPVNLRNLACGMYLVGSRVITLHAAML